MQKGPPDGHRLDHPEAGNLLHSENHRWPPSNPPQGQGSCPLPHRSCCPSERPGKAKPVLHQPSLWGKNQTMANPPPHPPPPCGSPCANCPGPSQTGAWLRSKAASVLCPSRGSAPSRLQGPLLFLIDTLMRVRGVAPPAGGPVHARLSHSACQPKIATRLRFTRP